MVVFYVGIIDLLYFSVLFIYGDFILFLFVFIVVGICDLFLSDVVCLYRKICDFNGMS